MRFSVLVVGGLGHVGSAVLSELSSLPIVGSVAVASRNPISKCNPVEVLDITESSLEATVEVFRKYDLVVDCAGPSAILGEPIFARRRNSWRSARIRWSQEERYLPHPCPSPQVWSDSGSARLSFPASELRVREQD